MSRALTAAGVAALLLAFASPAQAALTLTQSADSVVVIGDGGANRIQLRDGENTGPDNDYAFSFYSEDHEPVNLGDSGCVSDEGSPVENIYCGNGSFNRAVLELGGGNDTFALLRRPRLRQPRRADGRPRRRATTTAGAASQGIDTIIRGGDGDDDIGGHDGPVSVVEGGPGADRVIGGGPARPARRCAAGPATTRWRAATGTTRSSATRATTRSSAAPAATRSPAGPAPTTSRPTGSRTRISGNDTLHLVDGERDSGVCGFGADAVFADGIDLLPAQDCESVTRAAPAGRAAGAARAAAAARRAPPR